MTGPIPVRVQAGVYGAAMFSNTTPNMSWMAVPLFVASLDLSPFMIGLALGCRHVGPVLLAIHGGALMDRLGTRRVMLFFAVLGAIVPLLYPVFPLVWALILFQLFSGLADSLGWVGAQTLVGQVMRGDARYAGRMSFCTRIGLFVGPPLGGLAWDVFGPWGAFSMMSLWSIGVLLSVLFIPRAAIGSATGNSPSKDDLSWRVVVPRFSDYVASFRLLLIPAIAFAMMMTMLRHVGGGIQGSFYIVYLEGIGISGTMIGMLLTVNGIFGLGGSLTVAPLQRFIRAQWLLIVTVAATVFAVAITPAFESLPALASASALRGWALAASLVLLISLIANAVGPEMQGKAMGLRVTLNQVVWFAVPVLLGALIEVVGLEVAFYIAGGATLFLIALCGLAARRGRFSAG
jgi:predicted MFS family arabinose efflux permease